MNLVLDASVTMAWCFDDEATPETDALLDQVVETSAIVPTIWRFEVGNALQVAIRRKRIDAIFRDDALAKLAAMPITIDAETDFYAWTAVPPSRLYGHAQVRQPIHLNYGGLDDLAHEVVHPLVVGFRHAQQLPEPVHRENLNALVQISPELHQLVERNGVLAGHGANNLSLNAAPPP